MRVWFYVDPKAAVLAGKSRSGYLCADLTDADLAVLSAEHRAQLSELSSLGKTECPDRVAACLSGAVEPTIDGLRHCLDQAAAKRAAEAADNAAREARLQRGAEEVLAARRTTTRREREYSMGFYAYWDKVSPAWDYYHPESVRELPEAVAWQTEIDRANVSRQKIALADIEAQKEEAEKFSAAEAEKRARYNEACAALVRQNGDAQMVERLEADVLPADEISELVYRHLFSPLADWARYDRLTSGDIEHEEECYQLSVDYVSDDAESLTAEEWQQLKALQAAIGEAGTVKARRHTAKCENCDAETSRMGYAVSIEWHGKTHTREYAGTKE